MKNRNDNHAILRGDIYFADLGTEGMGSEQIGQRPVIVISNNVGNKFSPIIQVAVITSQTSKGKLPTHVEIGREYGLLHDSVALVEQTRTIDKRRLTAYIGQADEQLINKLNKAIEISFEVGNSLKKNKNINIVEDKIFEIHSIESTIQTLQDRGMLSESMFKSLYTERGQKLELLEKFCSMNNLNYLDYYKPVTYRRAYTS